jgi:hypothetical protein
VSKNWQAPFGSSRVGSGNGAHEERREVSTEVCEPHCPNSVQPEWVKWRHEQVEEVMPVFFACVHHMCVLLSWHVQITMVHEEGGWCTVDGGVQWRRAKILSIDSVNRIATTVGKMSGLMRGPCITDIDRATTNRLNMGWKNCYLLFSKQCHPI